MDPLVSKSLGLSNDDLYNLIRNVKSLLVYDIRTREQFAKGHIEDSRFLSRAIWLHHLAVCKLLKFIKLKTEN